ncbi:MAG TPA: sigma-70 family RNA polymerase sigma factor [Actinomycetota bacterium]|nr:sigma-70 family RNA polymerase sigma factor [Actinomycetota bacterium]
MPIGSAFEEVLAAARAGGDWAWRILYEDLAPAVLGYLRARGARDPEDLLGEVFLQVVRDLPGFEGDEAGFRAWVFVIAHRRLVDDVRRRTRRPETPVAHEQLEPQPWTGSVEGQALDAVAGERVRAVIEGLVPAQRDVLLLRIMGGLTIEEIAEAVGKRPGAVKALQRRGLAAVRRALDAG